MIKKNERFDVLDGWRGLSILFVLATHLLPLGPKYLHLNEMTGPLGMSIFFTLSGFLITNLLMRDSNIKNFIIRRFFRIIPLAWLYVTILFVYGGYELSNLMPNLFFYSNWPPMNLVDGGGHLWSLCVEMQFYIAIAFLVLILKKRALMLLPFLCLAITLYRVSDGVYGAINTYYRVDEILAGCVLALIYNEMLGGRIITYLARVNLVLVFILLLISSHPEGGFMNYLRPYFAAILVGASLYQKNTISDVYLKHKALTYIATISYALYVIHPILELTWLGEGDTVEKYLKRPMLFMVLFLLAHISTHYYEKKWIQFGKRLTSSKQRNNKI